MRGNGGKIFFGIAFHQIYIVHSPSNKEVIAIIIINNMIIHVIQYHQFTSLIAHAS